MVLVFASVVDLLSPEVSDCLEDLLVKISSVDLHGREANKSY